MIAESLWVGGKNVIGASPNNQMWPGTSLSAAGPTLNLNLYRTVYQKGKGLFKRFLTAGGTVSCDMPAQRHSLSRAICSCLCVQIRR